MEYNLTEKQQEGLNICLERYKNKKPYTIIAGYAGTGKSYLVNAIVDNFGFKEEEVAYACYTGKAALVLQKQGKNAVTLHKLLYNTHQGENGTFIHEPKEFLDRDFKLIVVDEISMCPASLWKLLLKHKVYIIGLGDPFQLPPIGDNVNLLDSPHIFLTEIMRQALDNDIIKYSMFLRQGQKLPSGIRGKNIQTYKKDELKTGMILWADQILCAKNSTRKDLNLQARQIFGKKGLLDEGDKLICTKNYWENLTREKETILVNGVIGTAKKITIERKKIISDLILENGECFEGLLLDRSFLEKGIPTPPYKRNGKVLRNFYKEVDYGYAITVHKAQGSQFDKVLVYDDCWLQGEEYRRWLYTAITRAVDKVVILL